jgi:hypothetical protein
MIVEKYLYLLLLLLVLISKELLIFNEEILVLFAFVIFSRLVVVNVNQLIVLELNTRTKKMKESYTLLKQLKNKSLFFTKKYTEKQRILSLFLIKSAILINNEILFLSVIFQKSLNNRIVSTGTACLFFSVILTDASKQQNSLLKNLYNLF